MLYDDLVQPSEYICHHGIKGQRWGIRRYQNKDGSLTSLGQKRMRKSIDNIRKSADRARLIPNTDKKAKERLIRMAEYEVNRNKFINELRRRNQAQLQDVIQKKRTLQSIMQGAANESHESFMNVDKTPEFKKAMNEWVASISDYNTAIGANSRLMMGDLANEQIYGTNTTYGDYVYQLAKMQGHIRLDRL